jgi:antitoxin ParD1/3/4
MRDGLRLLEEREKLREAKLEALRHEIAAGLESGASEALDIEAVKSEARRQRAAVRHGQ